MSITFDNELLELVDNVEETLKFSTKKLQTSLMKISTHQNGHAYRMYLPKSMFLTYKLSDIKHLYITQDFIKDTPDPNAIKVTVLKAGRDNLYINFPKTLILAYEPRPTHCRLTYNTTHNLWEYRLVKKEIS